MSVDHRSAVAQFTTHFGLAPTVGARAPGRVNLIGEHTDYNQGYVLPMAIDCETVILAAPRPDRVLSAFAANLDCAAQCSLDRLVRNPDQSWMDYIVGVAHEVAQLGKPLVGANVLILGDVPIGSGLSSSASLEMAALTLFEALGGFAVEGAEGPKLGQRVENRFLGLKTGIMDQFVVRMAKAGNALFLDCRSYQYEHIPMAFSDAAVVIANTGVARGLAASKYNERVEECAVAVRAMSTTLKRAVPSLRDGALEQLEACRSAMPERVFRRARHVIGENDRTLKACQAMRQGDPEGLGKLMDASHVSLRDDYEVSCPELDQMTEIARSLDGCYGSRMTGAGFGGCTVSLVAHASLNDFCANLTRRYLAATGLTPDLTISSAAAGAGILNP